MLEVYVDRSAVSTGRASQLSEPAGGEARGRLHLIGGDGAAMERPQHVVGEGADGCRLVEDRGAGALEVAAQATLGLGEAIAVEANVAATGSVAGPGAAPGSTWLSQPYVVSAGAAGSCCSATRGLSSRTDLAGKTSSSRVDASARRLYLPLYRTPISLCGKISNTSRQRARSSPVRRKDDDFLGASIRGHGQH